MKSMLRIFTLISLQCLLYSGYSQTTGIGQWRDHLPYNQCISVKEAGSRIFSATQYSAFYYDKEDNSVQRINKVNGLSDIGISAMNYDAAHHAVVIAYSNANLDLIKNNTIINISDIKRSSILGNKVINDITFIGQYAYLSCGFGIVVLDVDKEEIHDTYYIGPGGGQVNVLGMAKDDQDTLYAITDQGVYTAWALNQNLANYQSWTKDTRLPSGGYVYTNIINFGGQVVVSRHRPDNRGGKDTLFRHSNGQWSKWVLDYNNPVSHFESNYGKLIISLNYFIRIYNSDFSLGDGVYGNSAYSPKPADAILDNSGNKWIADNSVGLVSYDMGGNFSSYSLGGPLTSLVWSIAGDADDIYVVPGGWDGYNPIFQQPAIYHFDGTKWINYSPATDPGMYNIWDLTTVCVDPGDSKRLYAGSFTKGLLELYDGKVVNRYNEGNSTLRHHSASTDTTDIRVGGTAFDTDGNLWVVVSHNNQCLSRKSGSVWTGYNVPIINQDDLGAMIIDHQNQKWVIMRVQTSVNGSLLVFKEDPVNTANSKYITLTQQAGNGNIPGQTVYAMAVDKNGQVWVGTEKGIGVFFNPEYIFEPGENFDAQQILVQQGAFVQYLMENEKVTALAVDGGNRKWIGTEGGGLYLFSDDGTKQIYHFTTDNSPLLSNNIVALGISPESGEVFIGTDQGMVSFRGTATEGNDKFSNTFAYPNPVREDYEGLIGIKGLVTDAQVRITDIAGNLIYSTKAEGGQAVWDGKNFSGHKASTGIYLVYAADATGTEKVVTKILVVH